ncbi:MAG: MFS transporter [Vicinamibacterales bacterium]
MTVLIVCLAEILSMTPFSMFLALQPALQREWTLSNTQSGWVSSAYFGGYMLAVPLLASLTDRIDARTIWLAACGMAAAGAVGFSLFAHGTWSAAAMQVIAGAGLAGTYMPGLKLIADRLPHLPRPRDVAFYTTSFTMGSSLSFWIVGHLGARLPWRQAVAFSAAGPIVACLLVWMMLRAVPVTRVAHHGAHWNAVLASRDTMRYVVGYGAHVWELFALRAWVVPFMTFCASLRGTPSPLAPSTLAAIVALIGVPSSLLGAELTAHLPRRPVIISVMLLSILASLLVSPAARVSWPLLIVAVCFYSAVISADSAALTSGVLQVAPPGSRGTAMAVYSTFGFAAASAGTFAVGAMLDLMGGQSTASWSLAFAMMGAPNIIGALAVRRSSK